MESLSHLYDAYSKASVTQYDLILLDEIEAILSTFTGKTMEGRLLDVQCVLADVLKRAQYVLAGDAFLTNRSLAYMSLVLSEVGRTALVRNNTFQPYDRSVHWVPLEKNKELTDKAAMGEQILLLSQFKSY